MLESGKAIRRPRVALFASLDSRPDLRPLVDRLIKKIKDNVKIVDCFFEGDDFKMPRLPIDFAIVFGGDGSILRAGRQVAVHDVPVLGVNLGKLGFLADVQPEGFASAMENLRQGQFRLINHIMLDCEIKFGGRVVERSVVLNEVSILAGSPFRIIEIDLYVNGQLAASYNGDGLIVSTPVGSTAYNLSAGGPIVRKDLDAVVISPISPHTLTLRPIVDSADHEFELAVRHPTNASVVVDGNLLCELTPEHRVMICRSHLTFRMIEVATNNYYQTLREKLGWGVGFTTNPSVPQKSKKKK